MGIVEVSAFFFALFLSAGVVTAICFAFAGRSSAVSWQTVLTWGALGVIIHPIALFCYFIFVTTYGRGTMTTAYTVIGVLALGSIAWSLSVAMVKSFSAYETRGLLPDDQDVFAGWGLQAEIPWVHPMEWPPVKDEGKK